MFKKIKVHMNDAKRDMHEFQNLKRFPVHHSPFTRAVGIYNRTVTVFV